MHGQNNIKHLPLLPGWFRALYTGWIAGKQLPARDRYLSLFLAPPVPPISCYSYIDPIPTV